MHPPEAHRRMPAEKRPSIRWIDLVWLLFLLGLAFLPPLDEIHKWLILAAIGIFQFFERRMVARIPRRGPVYSMLIKIGLATLLLDHTRIDPEDLGINSIYWPIYFLPIVTAATYFGPIGTLLWTLLAGLAYGAMLIPAWLWGYEITPENYAILGIRILFLFLAAMLINRFAVENRRQIHQSQALSETLEETNRQLRRAEADARRSERLAALGQLSAGLAHEIRNPLGVIKGSAEMLSQKLRDSQPLECELAGYISSEVNRLNALVARFLDFARPQNLDLHPRQISEIVDRALASAQTQSPHDRIQIDRRYAANLPDVLADDQLCELVFANLILNAFQAMNGNDGLLRLSISPESSQGAEGVAVTVEDSGPGVPAAIREQIFNPFFTSKKDGVGLGLAIVAKIVDDHRGSIRLENDSLPGARFRVFLPATRTPVLRSQSRPGSAAK
jgi:two-component system sensor histidine kinase HydH